MDGNASSRYGEEKSANASKESFNPRLFGLCIRAVALLRRIGCGRAHFGPGDPLSREANLRLRTQDHAGRDKRASEEGGLIWMGRVPIVYPGVRNKFKLPGRRSTCFRLLEVLVRCLFGETFLGDHISLRKPAQKSTLTAL
jgi:hypothetical protein